VLVLCNIQGAIHVVYYKYDVGISSVSGSDRVYYTTDALMDVLLIIDAKQKPQDTETHAPVM